MLLKEGALKTLHSLFEARTNAHQPQATTCGAGGMAKLLRWPADVSAASSHADELDASEMDTIVGSQPCVRRTGALGAGLDLGFEDRPVGAVAAVTGCTRCTVRGGVPVSGTSSTSALKAPGAERESSGERDGGDRAATSRRAAILACAGSAGASSSKGRLVSPAAGTGCGALHASSQAPRVRPLRTACSRFSAARDSCEEPTHAGTTSAAPGALCDLPGEHVLRESARPLQRLSAPACPPPPAARYATRQTLLKTQLHMFGSVAWRYRSMQWNLPGIIENERHLYGQSTQARLPWLCRTCHVQREKVRQGHKKWEHLLCPLLKLDKHVWYQPPMCA